MPYIGNGDGGVFWPEKNLPIEAEEFAKFCDKISKNKGLLGAEIDSFKQFRKSAESATSRWHNSDEWDTVIEKIEKFDRLRQETKKCPRKVKQGLHVDERCFYALLDLADALFAYECMKKQQLAKANRKPDCDTERKFEVCAAGKKFLHDVGIPAYVKKCEYYAGRLLGQPVKYEDLVSSNDTTQLIDVSRDNSQESLISRTSSLLSSQ